MTTRGCTALIAEDEPLLRDSLERLLAVAWPQLVVVARARNGREAIDLFEAHHPRVCFLDIHMPGITGIEAARHIGRRSHLVFVTAYDDYAVQAFAEGVLDYLVKPVDVDRLAQTVARLQERLRDATAATNSDARLQQLAKHLEPLTGSAPLRWIRASVGKTVVLIDVARIDFLRAEEKYTVVAWRDDSDASRESVIRTPLKDLVGQLDAVLFAQVHRSFVVNLGSVARIVRAGNETATIHLKNRTEVLPVSRSYVAQFRNM